MADTEKPRAKPGTTCPFFRKDVSKVCHRCELWDAVPVYAPATGERSDKWGCTFKLATFVGRDVVQQTGQYAAALESFRNVIDERAAQLVEAARAKATDRIGHTADD